MDDTPQSHRLPMRVYYEDTDLAGIVYYANYLKFIERGRSEWLRGLGMDQAALKAETGQVFAVRQLTADYLRPARFDDLIEVITRPEALTPARIILYQAVLRDTELLFSATVTIVCIGPDGKATRIPPRLTGLLTASATKHP